MFSTPFYEYPFRKFFRFYTQFLLQHALIKLVHTIVNYYKCTWSIWAVDPVLGAEGAGQRMRTRYGEINGIISKGEGGQIIGLFHYRLSLRYIYDCSLQTVSNEE